MVTFDNQKPKKRNSNTSESLNDITIQDLIEKYMLPTALRCGISIYDFYEYTLKEVELLIEAYEERLKVQARMDYTSNITMASLIGCMFSKDAKMPKFEDMYSFLFDEEELEEIELAKQEAEERKRQQELALGWQMWATQFNEKRRNKNKGNTEGEED